MTNENEGMATMRVAVEKWLGCGVKPSGRDMPPLIQTIPYCLRQACFFSAEPTFFFAKRLFFRYGEGCEGRAWRATVCVTAKDNGEACFPLDFDITHTIGRQPSHPHSSGFFVRFMPHESPLVNGLPQPTLS